MAIPNDIEANHIIIIAPKSNRTENSDTQKLLKVVKKLVDKVERKVYADYDVILMERGNVIPKKVESTSA